MKQCEHSIMRYGSDNSIAAANGISGAQALPLYVGEL